MKGGGLGSATSGSRRKHYSPRGFIGTQTTTQKGRPPNVYRLRVLHFQSYISWRLKREAKKIKENVLI